MPSYKCSLPRLTHAERNVKQTFLLVPAANGPRPTNAINPKHQDTTTPPSVTRANRYDWAGEMRAARARTNAAAVEEIPVSKVCRIVEGKRVMSLHNLDNDGSEYFFTFNGNSDVQARLPEVCMRNVHIIQLALLRIGFLRNCTHPDQVELETSSQRMGNGDWALYIHAKAG